MSQATVPNFSFEDLFRTDRLELPIVSAIDPSLKMIATIFFDRSLQSEFRVEMQFFLNNVVADDLKQLEGSTGFLELINSYKKLVSDKIKNDRRRNMPSNESKNNRNKLEAKLRPEISFNKVIGYISSIFYSTKKLKTLAKVISYLVEFNGTLNVYTTNRGIHEAKSLARTIIELDADVITIFDKYFSSSSFDAQLRKELTSLHYFNVGLVNNLLFQEISIISRAIRGLIYIARSITAIAAISWNVLITSQGVYSNLLGDDFFFLLSGSSLFASLIPSIVISSLVYYLIPRIVSFFVRRKVIIVLR
jgi:hypothetical protein